MQEQVTWNVQAPKFSVQEACEWCGNEANSQQGFVFNYENKYALHNDCAAARIRNRYR